MPKPSLLFGTVGSPISTPKNPGGTVGGIRRTAELGLGALELAWVQSVRVGEGKCAEIKATAQEQGVARLEKSYDELLDHARKIIKRSRDMTSMMMEKGFIAEAAED